MQFTVCAKIISKIHRLKGTTIIQFGPPRSGTTLIYNILKDIFPKNFVETRHSYREKDRRFPTVVTYRNPLDSIISHLLVSQKILEKELKSDQSRLIVTEELLDKQVKTFEINGIWDVIEIQNNKNVLMLKYEDFVNDFDVIFNGIEKFFIQEIDIEKRNMIKNRYNIKSVETLTSKMKSYREIDKKTLFHGDHINKNKGQPNFHKQFLKDDQIFYLKNIYNKFLVNFNYI